MASSPNSTGLVGAVADLGLGDMLGQQVTAETDEQRKKRLADMQNRMMNSPAAVSLLGGYGGSTA